MSDPVSVLEQLGREDLVDPPALGHIARRAQRRQRRRRTTLAGACVAVLGLAAAAVLPRVGDDATTVNTATGDIALSNVPDGVSARLVDGVSVFVVRDGSDVYALLPYSQHFANEFVQWCPTEKRFFSPMHGELFDIRGRKTGGPAPRDMDGVRAVVAGDTVRIDPDTVELGAELRAAGRASDPVISDYAGFCANPVRPLPGTRTTTGYQRLLEGAWRLGGVSDVLAIADEDIPSFVFDRDGSVVVHMRCLRLDGTWDTEVRVVSVRITDRTPSCPTTAPATRAVEEVVEERLGKPLAVSYFDGAERNGLELRNGDQFLILNR